MDSDITTSILDKFLEDIQMSKEHWNMLGTITKTRKLCDYFNKEKAWWDKKAEAFTLEWVDFVDKWLVCEANNPPRGTILFKTYNAALISAKIINETRS